MTEIRPQILCLLVFVMSVAHEKYLQASTNNKVVKRKKKPNEVANQVERNATSEKQRSDIISLIVNRLKLELNTIDAAIGELNYRIILSMFHDSIEFFRRFLESALHPGGFNRNTCLIIIESKCGNFGEDHNCRKP